VQALERDAVPELHDEAAAGGEAVHVAEAVRDDQHLGAKGEPEAPPSGLAFRIEPEGARFGELGIRRRQPHQAGALAQP